VEAASPAASFGAGDWSDAKAAAAKAQAVRMAKTGNRKFDRFIFFDLNYDCADGDVRMKNEARTFRPAPCRV
jgi:hypothetical protein